MAGLDPDETFNVLSLFIINFVFDYRAVAVDFLLHASNYLFDIFL